MLFRTRSTRICTCARSPHICDEAACVAVRLELARMSRRLTADVHPGAKGQLHALARTLDMHIPAEASRPVLPCLVALLLLMQAHVHTSEPHSVLPNRAAAHTWARQAARHTAASHVVEDRASTAGEARR